jgi:arylformamidase
MSTTWSALEREYSPSSMVDDLEALETEYRTMSEAVRAALPPVTHRFGPSGDEVLDLFLAPGSTALHVFIHGGYWQALSKDDASFPAAGFVADGVSYAALNYTLAPHAKLPEIIEQCRRAVGWLYEHADDLGFDRDQVVISGSSAGAHLAAMVACTDWHARGVAGQPVKGLVLLSGVFELAPLIDTYINDAVGMSLSIANECSPLLIVRSRPLMLPVIIAWGERETETFKRQSTAFAHALSAAGAEVSVLEIPGRNHFDVVHDLSDPTTVLGRKVLADERKWIHGND